MRAVNAERGGAFYSIPRLDYVCVRTFYPYFWILKIINNLYPPKRCCNIIKLRPGEAPGSPRKKPPFERIPGRGRASRGDRTESPRYLKGEKKKRKGPSPPRLSP